jgi:hypothetical protein
MAESGNMVRMKRTLLRVGTALYFSLGLGVMGALAGLGWNCWKRVDGEIARPANG